MRWEPKRMRSSYRRVTRRRVTRLWFVGLLVTVVACFPTRVLAVLSVPFLIAITPDGSRAYVTDYYSHSIAVIDTATNTVRATVPLGDQPYGIVITPHQPGWNPRLCGKSGIRLRLGN